MIWNGILIIDIPYSTCFSVLDYRKHIFFIRIEFEDEYFDFDAFVLQVRFRKILKVL